MFSLLEDIGHGILDIPYLVVGLLVDAVNGWILAIAVLFKVLAALLPSFPALPTVPSEVAGGVSWFLPMSELLVVLGILVAAWVTWLGLQASMRWVKAR
jgi:hypothetical protein